MYFDERAFVLLAYDRRPLAPSRSSWHSSGPLVYEQPARVPLAYKQPALCPLTYKRSSCVRMNHSRHSRSSRGRSGPRAHRLCLWYIVFDWFAWSRAIWLAYCNKSITQEYVFSEIFTCTRGLSSHASAGRGWACARASGRESLLRCNF